MFYCKRCHTTTQEHAVANCHINVRHPGIYGGDRTVTEQLCNVCARIVEGAVFDAARKALASGEVLREIPGLSEACSPNENQR